MDLFSRGNSDVDQLVEVLTEAIERGRINGFRFKADFSPGWWRVVQGGVEVPHTLPQPSGCRADTQIVCPDTNHRICMVQRCDGEADCPLVGGQVVAWDESEEAGCVTTVSTTTTEITPRPGE